MVRVCRTDDEERKGYKIFMGNPERKEIRQV
jgi:hypothetical protein